MLGGADGASAWPAWWSWYKLSSCTQRAPEGAYITSLVKIPPPATLPMCPRWTDSSVRSVCCLSLSCVCAGVACSQHAPLTGLLPSADELAVQWLSFPTDRSCLDSSISVWGTTATALLALAWPALCLSGRTATALLALQPMAASLSMVHAVCKPPRHRHNPTL